MNTEFEIKVLDINTEHIKKLLNDKGFEDKGPVEFRRFVYDLPENNAWIRLRTNGQKTTLTYKRFESNSIDGVKELEVTVDNFENTNLLLNTLGYESKSYQENKRHLFVKDSLEVSIDEWPHIPPYLEIEGQDEASVQTMLEDLQLNTLRTTSETTSEVYKLYNLDIDSYKELTF